MVVEVEVRAGMRPAEEASTGRLLDALEWFPVHDRIAEAAGQLVHRYLRSHPGVEPVDLIIAATATAHDASLWTRDIKHFPMFDGLTSPY